MDDDNGKKSEDEMRSKLRIYLAATCAFSVLSQLMLFSFDYRKKQSDEKNLIQ